MPCTHTFSNLLSRTSFASDGAIVQQATTATATREASASIHLAFEQTQAASRMAANVIGTGIPLIPPSHVPEFPDPLELRIPLDDSSRLSALKPLCRQYGSYKHSHREVYDALVHLLGERTFTKDAVPADALALAVAVAIAFTVVAKAGRDSHVSQQLRDTAAVAATLVGVKEEAVDKLAVAMNSSEEVAKAFLVVYDIAIIGEDKSSTVVTELLWEVAVDMAFLLVGSRPPSDVSGSPVLENFMHFVSGARGIPLVDAPKVSVTRSGLFVYDRAAYRTVGFCQDGYMLSKVRNLTDDETDTLPLTDMLFRPMYKHNTASPKDACAACSVEAVSEDGRFVRYSNSLIAADIATAADVVVHQNGSVTFTAETLIRDQRMGKVIRTGPKQHSAALYDLHSLHGFDTDNVQNLSCLFRTDARKTVSKAVCEGVSVFSTLERMDNYTVAADGSILTITHGSETKYASRYDGSLKWAESVRGPFATRSFNIDDVVH